jgi:hypothetical protein
MLSDPGPDLVQDDRPFGVLQFTVDKVQSVLLELEVSKGAGHDGIPPLILKNCASTFEHPLSLIFNRSLLTYVFPNRCKLSYVTILSAIPKRSELLVYRTMYDDLKNLIYLLINMAL